MVKAFYVSFDVDDEYVKGKISFWMTVQKDGKLALVKGSGGEMLLDFKVVKDGN